jgi:hypothetical protein
MAKMFNELSDNLIKIIEAQKIFFVATAPKEGRINLSPKGQDCLKILNRNQVAYVNMTGSGNETSAHLLDDGRMTMMFCSFTKVPVILRLYGTATEIMPEDEDYEKYAEMLPKLPEARQIFIMDVQSAQTSCGYAVPYYEFTQHRTTLNNWSDKTGDEGLKEYREKNNKVTIDGLPTRLK